MRHISTLTPFLYPQLGSNCRPLTLTFLSSGSAIRCYYLLAAANSKKSSCSSRRPLHISAENVADHLQSSSTANKQQVPSFQDVRTLTLYSGAGGHGCVSFLREKFVPHGPPNGGDGGKGGDIYIQAVESETSLHKLGRMRVVKAGRGEHGQGSAKNGKKGADVVIKVPVGTIVREFGRDEDRGWGASSSSSSSGEGDNTAVEEEYYEAEAKEEDEDPFIYSEDGDGNPVLEDPHADRSNAAPPRRGKLGRVKPRRFAKQNVDDPASAFVHYPLSLAANMNSPHFPPQRTLRVFGEPQPPPIGNLDLSTPTKEPILLLRGSPGGLGNPHFITQNLRRPKFATKGGRGSVMRIELELKLLADVGLVGRPNAGKSSLLRCLTASRARVGHWAFTTLVPNVGTVVLDGGLGMGDLPPDSTTAARERYTIADIPGLMEDAGENKGLGWDFLRHIERAKGLAFVIDLSSQDPVEELKSLWTDIKNYEEARWKKAEEQRKAFEEQTYVWKGLQDGGNILNMVAELQKPPEHVDRHVISKKTWMVIANKADLEGSREKFKALREYTQVLEGVLPQKPIGCVAVSALRAGQWNEDEYIHVADLWKTVNSWLRTLVQ